MLRLVRIFLPSIHGPLPRGRGWFVACGLAVALAGAAGRTEAADTVGPAPPAAGSVALPPDPPLDLGGCPALGVETARITVVEISSFKCTHCRTFHETVFPRLREEYINPGKVRWVVVNASDDMSDQFSPLFAVARCAHRQGKYWELLDGLFAVARRPPSLLTDLVAKSPLLDRDELEICLRDRTVRLAVAGDFSAYARLKARGTPTFLVTKVGADGSRTEATIAGAQTLDYFRRALDKLLQTR